MLQIIIFCIFRSFWCADVKNNFFKIKNIILIYFWTKITLKNNVTTCSTTLLIVFKPRVKSNPNPSTSKDLSVARH